MENLNREAILRMLSGKTGNSSSGGGGGDIDLAGYASMIWVTENFVSIDFFRELFRAYDSNSQEILPNDTTSVVASIKAMVGTWTEQYLTALGNAGGGGGGGGGAQYLNDLLDVQLTTPLTDGQALVYNATLQKWVNGAAGVNMTTVWNALAGSTNEQINASHLSTALSGYVTTSAISDMATQTWVGQQGFATQTWVTSNFITIAYFDRLFRAYNGSTLVSHNDTTSTIDNIKAMFGFWTDFYLSALGTGGVSSVSISLSQLADVNVAGVTNGQVLSYNSTNAEWVPTTISNVTSLSALTDVALSSPTTYQVLMYDAYSTKWFNSSLKTINGQPIYGSGDISIGGGASGNYVPISGGTMTGSLVINSFSYNDIGLLFRNLIPSEIYNCSINTFDHNGDTYRDGISINGYDGVSICTGSNSRLERFRVALNGNVGINQTNPLYTLDVNGDFRVRGTNIFTDVYIYFLKNSGVQVNTTANTQIADLCSGSSTPSSGNEYGLLRLFHNSYPYITLYTYGNCWIAPLANGNVGIGTTSPSYKLDISGVVRINSSEDGYLLLYGTTSEWCVIRFDETGGAFLGWNRISNTFWMNRNLYVDGNMYATGAVTALSDIRHKTVIRDAAVSVEDIARMPAVMYQWNDGREDKELHVGSIAQNWQTVLPEVVMKSNDEEGTLSMQYGVAALVSSIIIARKVVNHEERIKQLEKENKELKKRLNIA